MAPTAGRIVHYALSAQDAEQIKRRRTNSQAIAERIPEGKWPMGAQAHIGNDPHEGDVVPMMIVKVWPSDQGSVNGQAFLDGNDVLWVTSAIEGASSGTWAWPPRIA